MENSEMINKNIRQVSLEIASRTKGIGDDGKHSAESLIESAKLIYNFIKNG